MAFEDDSICVVSRLNERGRQCLETKDHAEALIHFTKALTLLKKPEQALARAGVLNDIGHVKNSMGRWYEALTNFQEAALLCKALAAWSTFGRQMANIGSVLRERGDYAGSISMYGQALAAFSRAGDNLGRADQLGNLAYAHAMTGNRERARDCFIKAIEIYDQLADKTKADLMRWNLALLG